MGCVNTVRRGFKEIIDLKEKIDRRHVHSLQEYL